MWLAWLIFSPILLGAIIAGLALGYWIGWLTDPGDWPDLGDDE